MSGGLIGSRGIVSGKIKIAGAMELAEQLGEIFRKAKDAEKTLAYRDHKHDNASDYDDVPEHTRLYTCGIFGGLKR
ncbi:hypothetical protein BGZ47_007662 [Haplosporangium gracile]|nr:hypothetical protein BGZ47_007662 [Haplosporangium gracile]